MKRDLDTLLYILVAALFLCIVGKDLFSDGMFMDGLYYAAIANNMANGYGTFWSPQLSPDFHALFYEHPPLALGIQSGLFSIFGDSIYIERFYSFFTFLATGFAITLIWKELTAFFKWGWLPLLFWMTVGESLWAASNNMLENTMMVFSTFSVWLYFVRVRKQSLLWLMLAGVSLFFALFTKGFFCLYIWGLPFFDWLFRRKRTFSSSLVDTVILVVSSLIPVALLYFFVEGAKANMEGYFMQQVVRSVESIQTVDYRLKILVNFFIGILPQLLITGIIYLVVRKNADIRSLRSRTGVFYLFLALALGGVIPITISLKQRAFYILTVYPLFSVGFAYFVLPLFVELVNRLRNSAKAVSFLRFFTGLAILVGLVISVYQWGEIGRDKTMIRDVDTIVSYTGEGVSLSLCRSLGDNYSLHGYFARRGHVGLNNTYQVRREFFLGGDNCIPDSLQRFYNKVDIPTEEFHLFELID